MQRFIALPKSCSPRFLAELRAYRVWEGLVLTEKFKIQRETRLIGRKQTSWFSDAAYKACWRRTSMTALCDVSAR